jgi:hypothetical protein
MFVASGHADVYFGSHGGRASSTGARYSGNHVNGGHRLEIKSDGLGTPGSEFMGMDTPIGTPALTHAFETVWTNSLASWSSCALDTYSVSPVELVTSPGTGNLFSSAVGRHSFFTPALIRASLIANPNELASWSASVWTDNGLFIFPSNAETRSSNCCLLRSLGRNCLSISCSILMRSSLSFSAFSFALDARAFASATNPSPASLARFSKNSSPQTPTHISAFAKIVSALSKKGFFENEDSGNFDP